jgi:ParE toxin of type II toxin-antitoxin system, parDE
MELRWTEEAAADLERIADYLFGHTPDHAQRLVRALYEAPATLLCSRIEGGLARRRAHASSSCRPCPTSWSTRCAGRRFTSFASCTGRSSGRDRTTSPAGAIGCKAPRHCWHSRQRRQCRICNLRNLKGRGGFESHPLRHRKLFNRKKLSDPIFRLYLTRHFRLRFRRRNPQNS